MKITVTGRHLPVTDELRELAECKVGRLERHFERLARVEVVVDEEGKAGSYSVEMIAHPSRGTPLVSRSSEASLSAALEAATGKMDRQLVRLKDRKTERRRRKPAAAEETV